MRSLALCSVLIFDAQSSVSSIHVCRFHILYIGRCIVLTLTVLFLSECVCSVFFLLLLLLLLVVMLLFWFAHACLTRTHTLTAINSLLYEATSATCKCLKFSGIFTIYQLLCSRRLSLSLYFPITYTHFVCVFAECFCHLVHFSCAWIFFSHLILCSEDLQHFLNAHFSIRCILFRLIRMSYEFNNENGILLNIRIVHFQSTSNRIVR